MHKVITSTKYCSVKKYIYVKITSKIIVDKNLKIFDNLVIIPLIHLLMLRF